ncbi:EthD domain-containing protein [Chloroflexota bacterium]
MVKAILLLKRKPGLTSAEFRQQYEDVHAPLVLKQYPNIRKYVRNYITTNVMPADVEEPDFDCITEVWFDDMEGVQAIMDTMTGGGDASQALRHSGKVFVDAPKMAYLIVEEVESGIA